MLMLDDVDAGYGETRVLRGVSFTLAPGNVLCLMGRNGVGKTTCIKSIMGEITPCRGRIVWNERELTHLHPHQRATMGIGYVPQGRGIFPFLSVEENVLVGLEGRRVPRAERSRLVARVLAMFPVLEDILDRKGGALSGGQQQQLALARALVTEPQLLVLDEPTEGIQPSIVDEIGDLIHRLKSGTRMSILLVEQRIDFAQDVADEYVVIDQGSVAASGPVHELTESFVLEYLSV